MNDYDTLKQLVEQALESRFADMPPMPQQKLIDAMKYSLLAGGKRLRPVLVLAFCEAMGKSANDALDVSCAVEMLHTYSLIHDDLPCMDDDDLRRGRPTNHKVFGECTAVLAGDALQAEAFGAILRSPLPAQIRVLCAEALSDAAGIDGICGGQQLDMQWQGRALSEQELRILQSGKTASLIICACRMGAIIGEADEQQLETACTYGACIGSAFQIRDDMLDELSSAEEMGKTVGSDRRAGKTTYMSLFGREKCEEMIERLTEHARKAAQSLPQGERLAEIADMLCRRSS